jgi:hypothetical protein
MSRNSSQAIYPAERSAVAGNNASDRANPDLSLAWLAKKKERSKRVFLFSIRTMILTPALLWILHR